MIVERDVDAADLYEATRRGLIDLVRSLDEAQRATTVPATPDWSVQDVVAHVVGINADLRVGRFGATASDEWTATQVTSRRGRSFEELAAEWDAEAPGFEDGLRAFGYEMGSHFLGDLLQHVSDVRHAVGLPPVADDGTLLVALDFYLDSFHQTLVEAAVGAVRVQPSDDDWTLGQGEVVASWAADRFELFRTLGGRRDEGQIRAQAWTGDADLIIPLVSRYGLPAQGEGIVER
jgi:uncharacterized protein (TIGR03083 family)